jgi:hypothetical protein
MISIRDDLFIYLDKYFAGPVFYGKKRENLGMKVYSAKRLSHF